MRASEKDLRFRASSHRVAARGVLVVIAWVGLMAGGFAALSRYEVAPGQTGQAPVQSERFQGSQPSLVIALHPKCPCSRATLEELEKIYSRASQKFSISAFVFKPKGESESWTHTATVERVRKLGGAICVDNDGVEAEKLGLTTSGQILLYSMEGRLLYNGGITSARGHSGDNLGEQTVLDLLKDGQAAISSAPVFGCPLSDRVP